MAEKLCGTMYVRIKLLTGYKSVPTNTTHRRNILFKCFCDINGNSNFLVFYSEFKYLKLKIHLKIQILSFNRSDVLTGIFAEGIKPNFCCIDFKINYVYGITTLSIETVSFYKMISGGKWQTF